jgi:siroheme synthase
MGVTRLRGVVEALVAGGLDPATPAAIVQRATLPGQRAVTTVLERLATERQRHGLTSPSIIVIGKVVGHARLAALAATIRGASRASA